MSDSRQLYPLTTPGGDAIPFDVFRPFGLIPVTVADTVSAAISIPAGVELLLVYATIPCIMRFGDTASIPSSGTHQVDSCYIPDGVHMIIDPNAITTFTVIGTEAGETGKVWINTTKTWKDLQIDIRLNRT